MFHLSSFMQLDIYRILYSLDYLGMKNKPELLDDY